MPMPLAMALPLSIFAKDKYRMRAAQSQETARYILEERDICIYWESICFSVSQAKYKVDSTCRSYRICDPTKCANLSLPLWSQRDNDVAIRVDNLFIFIFIRMCQLASFQWAYTISGGGIIRTDLISHILSRDT